MYLTTIIFDFDGVIADTNKLHLSAWDQAYHSLTGTPIARLERFSGRRTETIASILSKESHGLFRPSDIRKAKDSLLISQTLPCSPIPGFLDFVAEIESHSVRWGVASNSSKTFITGIMETFKIHPKILVTPEDVVRAKPSPDLFWHCANLLEVATKNRSAVVVFEDTEHGIKAALAAGMRPFGIATDTTEDHLLKAGAEKVFSNFLNSSKIWDVISRSNVSN